MLRVLLFPCFHLPHRRLIFFSMVNVTIKSMGVAMGSPFLGFHEETWLNNFDKADIVLYRRYVDDTFCVFNNEQDAMSFFEFINSQHPKIYRIFSTFFAFEAAAALVL